MHNFIMTILKIQNLSLFRNNYFLLKNISLEILAGEIVLLTGENGCGKSTLLKTILNLESTVLGQVFLFGTPLSNFKNWGEIGYLPQSLGGSFFDIPSTVKELVLNSPNYNPSKSFKWEEIKEICGLEKIENKQIKKISGGQKQRAFLARSLISKPKLLCLDEPMTGVDIEGRDSFYELLKKLKKKGIAALIISHDTEGFKDFSDRVLKIKNQKIQI